MLEVPMIAHHDATFRFPGAHVGSVMEDGSSNH
jgi:hypothetical protein